MLPMVVKPLGDSTIVARTPVLSSDACNGSFIIISSTLEDGGVERTKNLQEVSAPNSNEYDEGVESEPPKKK